MARILLRRYFVVSGYGEHDLSNILAFDVALKNAGISNVNLVGVSSMLPVGSKRIKFSKKKLSTGEVVFCVLARADGSRGDSLAAGLGIASGYDTSSKQKYGFILESHSKNETKDLRRLLDKGLEDMAVIRNFTITKKDFIILTNKKVIKKYGSCIVTLVYR